MRNPIEVPEDFSETLENNLADIQEAYIDKGTLELGHLAWLFQNTRHLDRLMHVTANFAQVADETVTAMKAEIADKEEEIDRLNAILALREDEIDSLLDRLDRLDPLS